MRTCSFFPILILTLPSILACSSSDDATHDPVVPNEPSEAGTDASIEAETDAPIESGSDAHEDAAQGVLNQVPDFIPGEVYRAEYDGIDDDLLTAGLGQAGLANPVPPAVVDPESPTGGELRRLAIYNNYRAIVDVTPGGGYGTLYGPAVDQDGDEQGRVPGKEYLAYSDDGSGKDNVVLMVQLPSSFDPERPCIVAAPSSGSRGVYGAIGSAGEWGLKKGCAVAYTDKGTGIGVHDLEMDTVNDIQGKRVEAKSAGKESHFTAIEEDAERSAFLTNSPHRLAFKHAHSTRNPEKHWGNHVLQTIEFAFYVINLEENFGSVSRDGKVFRTIQPEDTIVIASSVSNGGGASIRAAEIDGGTLIDGVAVSEPNVNPPSVSKLRIRQGSHVWESSAHSQPLLVYTTLLNVFAPCAVLAPSLQGAPLAITPADLGTNRCEALHSKGLLQAETTEEQALEALQVLHDAGMIPEQDLLLPSHHALSVYESVGFTYTSAYGQFGVADAVCGFSFAGLEPATFGPAKAASADLALLFGTSNGVPPSAGVHLFNDDSLGGVLLSRYSVSPSTQKQDQNLDGALCMHNLARGKDETGAVLTGDGLAKSERVTAGMQQVQVTGKLGGVPTIIVHGRSDALLPANHTSRAYYGVNQIEEGVSSPVRYIEVANGQHLDVLNGIPDFGALYIPLHYYFIQAMDRMWDHLTTGADLPESQFVRAVARGKDGSGAVLPIESSHLPPIVDNPAEENRIEFKDDTVVLPESSVTPTALHTKPGSKAAVDAAKRMVRQMGFALP